MTVSITDRERALLRNMLRDLVHLAAPESGFHLRADERATLRRVLHKLDTEPTPDRPARAERRLRRLTDR